ncbi:MAG: hypothetical protein HC804_04080 [Anaerolineae bacterium]|nr:hypothetical protein [Anaerolineae bacterium]
MIGNPGKQAIRVQDWEQHLAEMRARPSQTDRMIVPLLGLLCGVGASLLIGAWVLLLQEVVGLLRRRSLPAQMRNKL